MKFVYVLGLMAVSSVASANMQQIASEDYTCAELRTMLQQQGEIVFVDTNGSEAYYSTRSYCAGNFVAETGYTMAKDTAQCDVGFICQRLVFNR